MGGYIGENGETVTRERVGRNAYAGKKKRRNVRLVVILGLEIHETGVVWVCGECGRVG